MQNIAIIGSGFCGVSIAKKINPGFADVVIYDKGKRPGGRVASKIFSNRTYDYGPAFIPSSLTKEFPGEEYIDGQLWPNEASNGFIPLGGVSSFAAQLPTSIKSYQDSQVMKCLRKEQTFSLELKGNSIIEDIDILVVTAPSEQSAELIKDISPDLSHEIRQTVKMTPTWVVLLETQQIIELDPLLEVNSEIVKNIRSEHTKLGRRSDNAGSWFVIECSDQWSQTNVEKPPEWVTETIINWFRNDMGLDFSVRATTAHRWRYASTKLPLSKDFLRDASGDLWIAGDWCLGNGIASAIRSGKIVGDKINSELN